MSIKQVVQRRIKAKNYQIVIDFSPLHNSPPLVLRSLQLKEFQTPVQINMYLCMKVQVKYDMCPLATVI